MNNENHLIELETKIAYLEDHLQQLSDVVAVQQKEIQTLNKTNKLIVEKLKAALAGEEINSDFEKPPHY